MMFLITMVLASHAAQETVKVRLSAGQSEGLVTIKFLPEMMGISFIGNVISYVQKDSQAARGGVQKGWSITKVGEVDIPRTRLKRYSYREQQVQKLINEQLVRMREADKPYQVTFKIVQCTRAMNKINADGTPWWKGYRAPIYDDTAPAFRIKGSNRVLCPHFGHKLTLGETFVTTEKTWCKARGCSWHPAGTKMYKCLGCHPKGEWNYCTGSTNTIDGTYRKLAGAIKINKHDAGQSEGSYGTSLECKFKFGDEDPVLNRCGDHVWRNENGLLMMRSPLVRHNSWRFDRNDRYFPCYSTHAWVIVKSPCQYPHLAETTGVMELPADCKGDGCFDGTFASFCNDPKRLKLDFVKRENDHLPPTSEEQRWELQGLEEDETYERKKGDDLFAGWKKQTCTVERGRMLKRKCSDGMPGCTLKFVKDEVQEEHKMQA